MVNVRESVAINCHSSICINGRVYIDPYNIKKEVHNADVIFLTHSHYDHCDLQSIECIMNNETIIVAPEDTIVKVKDIVKNQDNLIAVSVGQEGECKGVRYSTFPAYNIEKPFHSKENSWVGYQLIIDGVTYLVCGDTDVTPELRMRKADVLLIPIGGKYTMNYTEASEVTNYIKPKVVIPTHYGSIVGDKEYGQKFEKLVDDGIEVVLF